MTPDTAVTALLAHFRIRKDAGLDNFLRAEGARASSTPVAADRRDGNAMVNAVRKNDTGAIDYSAALKFDFEWPLTCASAHRQRRHG